MIDVCIIGAGTSGLMAAIAASENGASVTVIDKNKRAGKKLRLTGGGRCNVTNAYSVEEIISHIPGNGRFLYSAFSQFNNQDIQSFFETHGVSLKEEDHGRLFPTTDSSKTIVDTLVKTCQKQGVHFIYNDEVTRLLVENKQVTGVVLHSGKVIHSHTTIIATGGITYRYTGSTGDGYRLAKAVGHHVTPLYPTEAPLVSDETFIKDKTLQGLSLRDVTLSVMDEKKVLDAHTMDLLFTHFGLSGPCALRSSTAINHYLKNHDQAIVAINAKPGLKKEAFLKLFKEQQTKWGDKKVKNTFTNFVPERYFIFLCQQAGIDINQPLKQLTLKNGEQLYEKLTDFKMTIKRTWPLEKAFVTGGGVHLKEINPKTMESKKCAQLFFCGEVLDINGHTGGYNITAAFSTGYVAGKHAAEIASYYHY